MIPYIKRAISIGKKIFLAAFILLGAISLLIYFSQKDKTRITLHSAEDTRTEIYQTLEDTQLNSTKEGKAALVLYRGIMCGAIGEGCTDNPADGDKNFDRSMFGYAANLVALPYTNPPASGVQWAYTGLQEAGFIPKSYAAEGIGLAAIKPFYAIWEVFRNIAYSALVIVIVIIGLLIMFRVKVDPHTVIKLENSLPRIVISLIMITFSFAIAGFMIDLMYLVMAIVISQLSTVNIGDFTEANRVSLLNTYLEPGFYDIYPRIGISIFGVGKSLLGVLPTILQDTIRTTLSVIFGLLLAKLIHSSLFKSLIESLNNLAGHLGGNITILGFGGGGEVGGSVGNLFGIPSWITYAIVFIILFPLIGPFLITLFIFFTIFFLMIRVFFLLLRTYVTIILFIVFSPVILLLGALPGKNHFFNWIKNLAVHLLIFPVILTIILVGSIIVKVNNIDSPVWRPPFLYGIDADSLSMLIGLGMILIIPDLVKAFKERMGIKPTGISFGLGTFFGGAAVIGGGAAAGFSRFAGLGYQMTHLMSGPLGSRLQSIPGFGRLNSWLNRPTTGTGGGGGGGGH